MNAVSFCTLMLTFTVHSSSVPETPKLKVIRISGELGGLSTLRCILVRPVAEIAHVEWRSGTKNEIVYVHDLTSKEKSGPRGRFSGRNVSGRFNDERSYHEISIQQSISTDEDWYSCRAWINSRKFADENFHLSLVVPPQEPPAIVDANGSVLSGVECSSKNIPVIQVHGKSSFICRVGAARPTPKVDWEHATNVVHDQVTEASKKFGMKVFKTRRKVDVDSVLRCTVSVPDPKTGGLNRTQLCLGLQEEGGIQYSRYYGGVTYTYNSYPLVRFCWSQTLVVVFAIVFLCGTLYKAVRGFVNKFQWIRIRFIGPIVSVLLVEFCVLFQEKLCHEKSLSFKHRDGNVKSAKAIASLIIIILLIRLIFSLVALIFKIFKSCGKKRKDNFSERHRESMLPRVGCILLSVVGGPGIHYFCVILSHLKSKCCRKKSKAAAIHDDEEVDTMMIRPPSDEKCISPRFSLEIGPFILDILGAIVCLAGLLIFLILGDCSSSLYDAAGPFLILHTGVILWAGGCVLGALVTMAKEIDALIQKLRERRPRQNIPSTAPVSPVVPDTAATPIGFEEVEGAAASNVPM